MSGPQPDHRRSVAVVGAGLAGLTATAALQAVGRDVVVWEKSRGAGGRTATRRGPDGMRFDHGAPFLHDADGQPPGALPSLAPHHLVLPDGSSRATVVGDGAANAPAKALAVEANVQTQVRVSRISRVADGSWELWEERGSALGRFGAVIVTAPAPQTAELIGDGAPELAARASTVAFDPCWSAMAAWDEPLGLPFTAVHDRHGLTWAVAEAAKPGRAPGERWVLQADPNASTAMLEDEPEAVAAELLARLSAIAGRSLPAPSHLAAHRWRYARPSRPLAEPCLRDGTLLVAGDWCGGTTAGAAVRSGRAAAAALASSV